MKQITVLGATGLVGKVLVKQALNQGYKVKALVRKPAKLNMEYDHLEIVKGDYFNSEDVNKVLEGSDAVLSTIGPPLGAKIDAKQIENYKMAIQHLIKQMEANGQKRIISISGAGIKMPKESLPLQRRLMRTMLKIMAKPVVSIKDFELNSLLESRLDWTNVRPPMIKEDAEGSFVAHDNRFIGMKVNVYNLASFMINEIEAGDWIYGAPLVATK